MGCSSSTDSQTSEKDSKHLDTKTEFLTPTEQLYENIKAGRVKEVLAELNQIKDDPELNEEHKDNYDTILQLCTSYLKQSYSCAVTFLLKPQHDIEVEYMHQYIHNGEMILVIELTCIICQDVGRLKKFKSVYEQKYYGTDITVNLRHLKVLFPSAEDVVFMVQCLLKNTSKTDEQSPEDWASVLVEAMDSDNLFQGDNQFKTMFEHLPLNDIRIVLELFLKKTGREISVEMEKYFTKQTDEADLKKQFYICLAQIIRNPAQYFDERISKLLGESSSDEAAHKLIFKLFIMDKTQLDELKSWHETSKFEPLSMAAKQDITNETLCKLVCDRLKQD